MSDTKKRLKKLAQPWSPARATERIRAIALSGTFRISYKYHATEQMSERDLIMGDVLYVLENGFVYDDAEGSTRSSHYKYKIESKSPNSGAREVRVVVIPDWDTCECKIITVMWVDEPMTGN